MAWAAASLSSSRPTSARLSFGRRSAPPPSTPAAAPSSRAPSSPSSTCSPPGKIRCAPARGLLQTEPAQPDESGSHRLHLWRGDLLPGLQGGPAHQVGQVQGPVLELPHQALLHLQHPHHSAECSCLQLVHDLSGQLLQCECNYLSLTLNQIRCCQ